MTTLAQIQNILNDKSRESLEEVARESARLTRQFFGRTVSLYAPIYLSNYCSSWCTYCGFHSHNRIKRIKLTPRQINQEMQTIAATGLQNILMLTGESYKMTPVSYLKQAAQIAQKYFQGIMIEVHPMDEADYRELFASGVDAVTVYQETYDRERYAQVHLSGLKKAYDYRRETPTRAAAAGMRSISLGILLGLSDPAQDLFALYTHLREMEKNFPGVEYSVSFPRMRTIKEKEFAHCDVDDILYAKIISLTRILFPRVGINLSTREAPQLRDHLLELGVTRMSAGSNTSVGGYSLVEENAQDPQFDIQDDRSVSDVVAMLKRRNFDPVFTDWRTISNTP